jgi:hypothetical protein
MAREGNMRCCSLVCVAVCLTVACSGILRAAGIEAAEEAEKLIQSCNTKSAISVPRCLNDSLNRRWKYELEYTGKPFSAIGLFVEVRKSIIGNLFAFIDVDQYRVACKVTQRQAETLSIMEARRAVLVIGVLESYHLTFNLHRYHHLRLTPYCSIEAVA